MLPHVLCRRDGVHRGGVQPGRSRPGKSSTRSMVPVLWNMVAVRNRLKGCFVLQEYQQYQEALPEEQDYDDEY